MFTILTYLLAAVGLCVVVAVIFFGIAYVIVARRLTIKMRDTVQAMERVIVESAGAARSSRVPHQADSMQVDPNCIPPMRIHLEPFNAKVDPQINDWLVENEFRFCGSYVIEELGNELLWCYLSLDRRLVASIRRPANTPEPYVEFCFDLGHGGRGGVANPPGATVQLPPDAVGRFYPKALSCDFELLGRMWQEAKALSDNNDVRPIEASQIQGFYEEAHATEMDCRIKAGGVSAEEIRTSFAMQGLEASAEDIEDIQEQWQTVIENHLLDFSSRALNQVYSGRSILVVYDGSVDSYLIGRMSDMLESVSSVEGINRDDLFDTFAELKLLLMKFSPREAIARFRPLLPGPIRYNLVDQLKSPIEADLYVLP